MMRAYLEAQLRGDRTEALAVLDRGLASGMGVEEAILDVVLAAQREIGVLWEKNVVSVAQEHLATAVSQLALARLYERLPRRRPNGKAVIVTCVEGELHELGARVVADFLEMAGYRVRFLGADVPTRSLVELVRREPADLVALSATMSFHLDALRAAIAGLREALGDRIKLAVGGNAFVWDPSLRTRVDVALSARDAKALVRSVDEALGVAR